MWRFSIPAPPPAASMAMRSLFLWMESMPILDMNTNTRFTSSRYCRAIRTRSFILRSFPRSDSNRRKHSSQRHERHEERQFWWLAQIFRPFQIAETRSKYHVTTKRTKDTKDWEIITFQFFNFVPSRPSW